MKLHPAFSIGLMAVGAVAAVRPLQRRAAWDQANRTVYLALDGDDVVEAATRAGLPLGDLLHRLWHAGATHLTVPEDTLARLAAQGRLGPAIPRHPLDAPAPLGRWTYLAAHEPDLLPRVQAELAARQPRLGAQLIDDDGRPLLAVSGDLQALQPIGLGFDEVLAAQALAAGLQPLPRPVSYPWPTAAAIDRSLAQAAKLAGMSNSNQPAIVAFQGIGAPGHPGELVLGHEMLMHETIDALRRHGLAFAYFAESRHQRGDWFLAKSLAPAVVLAHQFTQPQLVPEDMHSAAHRWGLLAREKGIRLALLHLFKVVHATTPLDCVDYVAAVADVLVKREGMHLAGRPDFRPAAEHHSHGHGHDHAHGRHHHHGERGAGSGEREEATYDGHGGDHEMQHHRDLGFQHHHHGDEPAAETIDVESAPPTSHHDDHDHEHDHDHSHEDTTHHHEHNHVRLWDVTQSRFTFHVSLRDGSLSRSPLPRDDAALPWLALIPAGAGVLALSELLDLPDAIAIPLTVAGLFSPLVVRRLDRPANELEAAFRPSYAPKLIALGTAALAPLAASLVGYRSGLLGLAEAIAVETLAAAGLAATVAEHDYTLRIEEVKTYQFDWILPLAGALAFALPDLRRRQTSTASTNPLAQAASGMRTQRLAVLALAAGAGIILARSGLLPADLLAALDSEHSAEHTHHLSRAQAAIGDARMALSPRPLRKWTAPTLAAQAIAAFAPLPAASVASITAALGETTLLAGFRQAARPAMRTLADRLPLISVTSKR